MSAEALLGGHKDRFDVGLRALQGGKRAGPRELARIREREVGVSLHPPADARLLPPPAAFPAVLLPRRPCAFRPSGQFLANF